MSRNSKRRVDGTLVWPPRGDQGFGYDPMFLPDGHARTFGEMASEEKHGLPPRGKGLSHRARAFMKLAEACLEQPELTLDADFGVYVHWPFCLSKCPYCDFNSHVRRAAIDEPRFVRAFAAEIAGTAARVPGRDRFLDLFRRRHAVADAAGDSRAPSSMPIARHWTIAPDAEITLEANPTSVEAGRFRGYRAAGVNRVSLGVQALDDRALAELGRLHSAREALDAVAVARNAFARVSFDLIYARPQQTPQDWASELKRALAEAGEHLSLYQLTIEADTPFAALHAAGKLKTPDDEISRALYDTTQDVCAAHGLPAYEISNHARPGAECRHNLIYWRAHEYAGIGPGAHGRLDIDGDAPCHRDRKAPGSLARRRREQRTRPDHRRRADARGNGR